MKYLFHLGRNPELSSLEVVSFLQRTNRNYKILKITKKFILLEISSLDSIETIKNLGGTTKISSELNNLEEYIGKSIKAKKFNYAINILESSQASIKGLTDLIKKVSKQFKAKPLHKHVKENEISPSKSQSLELELTLYKNNVYKVIAVSDPKSYKNRDEVRPFFDPLQVISVRLAKILINLAQPNKNTILLDPFCGLGTIIQEASLLGIQTIGSDNNLGMVKKCQSNITWAKKKLRLKVNPRIRNLNVRSLSKSLNGNFCIATEPYLGPYLKKLPWENEAREIARELSKIYEDFLREASKLLKQGSKVALVVPTFKTRTNKIIRIGFQSMLEKYNFGIYQPLNNTLIPIDYIVRNNKIRRKIYVLEKLK